MRVVLVGVRDGCRVCDGVMQLLVQHHIVHALEIEWGMCDCEVTAAAVSRKPPW